MHQHLGKVHCDLKLDNILCVRRANRFMQGKICDFGLTRGEFSHAVKGTQQATRKGPTCPSCIVEAH